LSAPLVLDCKLIASDVLPLRCAVLAGGPDAINNAIDYAKLYSRSHVAVIRVYDSAGNMIETHECTAAVDANGNKTAVPPPQAMLNEFLKEHGKVQDQDATIAQVKSTAAKQEATIARQQEKIEALAGGLQKVTVQIEMKERAP
jgi:uncharacterized coiled-coil protein SlyX